MLARFALALQNGQFQGIQGVGGQGFGEDGGTIVVDENCSVSDSLGRSANVWVADMNS